MKSIIIALLAVVGLQAHAAPALTQIEVASLAQSVSDPAETTAFLKWTVGDSADYKMSGGIIQGDMKTLVREEVTEGFWVQQDMNLGFMGKQKVEILYDKNNGEVLQLLVNGQKQTPPDPNDMEVIDMKGDRITVPKGTFDCTYVKIHNKKENNDMEAWINPDAVPISGMLKTVAPSQLGQITIELTDFKKQ